MTETEYMRLAIRKTQEGIAAGQSPFGAIIVTGDKVIAATHNTVKRDCDPTAHAELSCIRAAARALKTNALDGCVMYTTTEPCPMCLSAIHWSRIERVVFGASIADAAEAGFAQLQINAKVLAELVRSSLKVEGGLLRDECAALFAEWQRAALAEPS